MKSDVWAKSNAGRVKPGAAGTPAPAINVGDTVSIATIFCPPG
jgi:hypothetical protein